MKGKLGLCLGFRSLIDPNGNNFSFALLGSALVISSMASVRYRLCLVSDKVCSVAKNLFSNAKFQSLHFLEMVTLYFALWPYILVVLVSFSSEIFSIYFFNSLALLINYFSICRNMYTIGCSSGVNKFQFDTFLFWKNFQ